MGSVQKVLHFIAICQIQTVDAKENGNVNENAEKVECTVFGCMQKQRQVLVSDLSGLLHPLVYSYNKERLCSSLSCPLQVRLQKAWSHLAPLEVLGLLSGVCCCVMFKSSPATCHSHADLPAVSCRLAVCSWALSLGSKGRALGPGLTHSFGRRLWGKHWVGGCFHHNNHLVCSVLIHITRKESP